MAKFLYLVLLSAVAWGAHGGLENGEDAESDTANPKPIPSFRCLKMNGIFPNTDNCRTYFKCFNGKSYLMVCPSGLHYSYKSQQCEKPCDAYCEKSLACECKWPTCGLNDLCSLLPEVGPCRAGFFNYYFNRSTGQCEKFLYGGCKGNENNFQKKEDCEKACTKTDEDNCPAGEVWSDCQAGCQMKCGDEGREKPCLRMCVPGCVCEEPGAIRGPDNKCVQPPLCPSADDKQSPVNEYTELSVEEYTEQSAGRYTVQPVDKYIEKIIDEYTEQHDDRFINQPIDEYSEQPADEYTEQPVDEYTEQPEPPAEEILDSTFECGADGLYPHPTNCTSFFKCEKEVPSLYSCPGNRHFNNKTKKCESPCEAHCDRTYACKCKWPTCGTNLLCSKPPRPGPCKGNFKRYYFNKLSGNCETFNYGGCLGNENNFHTQAACERKCKHSLDICKLPAKAGVCKGNFTRYYFNYKTEKCETFSYGGCKGNHNNFKTLAECETTCLRKQQVISSEQWCEEDGGRYDYDNCSRYIRCFKGRFQIINCPPGLRFNEATEKCDTPCGARRDVSLEKVTDGECLEDGNFTDLENCGHYIHCSDGQRSIVDCPEGLHFNEESGICDLPCDAHCNPSLALECGWPMSADYQCPFPNGKFNYPGNNRKYVECVNGLAIIRDCMGYRQFDSRKGKCDYH